MSGHDAWIAAMIRDQFEGEPHRTLGRCRPVAEEMSRAFDDLRIARGHVHCPEPWGKRGHWWLVDAGGEIVDPTAGQFTCGVIKYEEYRDGDPVRLGACMDCGAAIWGTPGSRCSTFCNAECQSATERYLSGGVL